MRDRSLLLMGFLCALFACAPPRAWELPPPPALEAPVVAGDALHRDALTNGLEVVVLEDRRLPRVVLSVVFRRGEATLARSRAGLASFTAELMTRGAGDRDALSLAEYVDEIGASLSGAAGWDTTSFHVGGLSRDLDRLLEILADVVLQPRFQRSEATKLRGERLAALERARDDPGTLVSWNVIRTLYPEHRFGLPASGDPKSVKQHDAARAREFYSTVLIPNNAVLAASGDVTAVELIERARQIFSKWQPGRVPEPGAAAPPITPFERRVVIVDRPDLEQARIAVAHEGIARTAGDRIPTSVMNTVIGGSGFSSRLMSSLRSEGGLTYSVSSGYSLRRTPGPFLASTFTRVPEVRRTLTLLLSELERARREPPDESELAWARTLMTGRFAMGLETSAAVLDSLVDLDVYGLPEDSLDTFRSRVRAVSEEDVAAAARAHIHPERAAIVLVGPADALRPQVEDFGPVEIVQP